MPPEGHVNHVAFWAGPVPAVNHLAATGGACQGEKGAYEGAYQGGGPKSTDGGFWGIWELVSGVPHFGLENGGVFRLVPLSD